MADIELVIKIPEEMYKTIQSRDWKNAGRWFSEEWKAIHNGIPLPKGHGRIVDISNIEYMKALHDAIHNKLSWEEAIRKIKESAPTIIEADIAGSEDKR